MKMHTVAAGLAALLSAGAVTAGNEGYAETVYRDFTELHQGAVAFELRTLASGPLNELRGAALADITGMPTYTVTIDESDFMWPTAGFARFDRSALLVDDLDFQIDGFAQVGNPLELGAYRLLQVTVNAGKASQQHQAVEFCWAVQNHCVVFDPSVNYLDSEVNSYRAARAAGWRLEIHEEPADGLVNGARPKSGTCGLASNPDIKSRRYYRAARTVEIKNTAGAWVVVRKHIGAAEAGIRCNSSCYPDLFGYANTSSASATLPRSVDCDNETNAGRTGRRGKMIVKTGCADRLVAGANLSITRAGTGVNVTLNVDSTGGVHSNGTSIIDTCGYY